MSAPEPVRITRLTPEQLAERYPSPAAAADVKRRSWKLSHRRSRELGLDRFGKPRRPRELGTNPRAQGTNPRATRG